MTPQIMSANIVPIGCFRNAGTGRQPNIDGRASARDVT